MPRWQPAEFAKIKMTPYAKAIVINIGYLLNNLNFDV